MAHIAARAAKPSAMAARDEGAPERSPNCAPILVDVLALQHAAAVRQRDLRLHMPRQLRVLAMLGPMISQRAPLIIVAGR